MKSTAAVWLPTKRLFQLFSILAYASILLIPNGSCHSAIVLE